MTCCSRRRTIHGALCRPLRAARVVLKRHVLCAYMMCAAPNHDQCRRAARAAVWRLAAQAARACAQVPINGEPPKERLDSVREDLATAAAFICRTEEGRKALMAVDGHEALKKGYEYEEHAGTMAAMEEAARALMGVQLEDGEGVADVQRAGTDGGMVVMG